MVKKSDIAICDRCKIRVATRKCFICNDDLCSYCKSKTDIYIAPQVNLGKMIDCCKKCLPKLKEVTNESEGEILKAMRETITTDLRKRLILDELQDKGVKK